MPRSRHVMGAMAPGDVVVEVFRRLLHGQQFSSFSAMEEAIARFSEDLLWSRWVFRLDVCERPVTDENVDPEVVTSFQFDILVSKGRKSLTEDYKYKVAMRHVQPIVEKLKSCGSRRFEELLREADAFGNQIMNVPSGCLHGALFDLPPQPNGDEMETDTRDKVVRCQMREEGDVLIAQWGSNQYPSVRVLRNDPLPPNFHIRGRPSIISQPITGIHTFDLPACGLSDIALWLRTVESRFALRRITKEETQFHYLVAASPLEIATDLRGIMDSQLTETPYTTLKKALISCVSPSTQKRLQPLISEEDLGERKPTQLIRRLEQLSEGQQLEDTMFKQLLLQRLSSSVQAPLAPNILSSSVQMLAETADRKLEYYQPPTLVNFCTRVLTTPTIDDVVKRLDALTLEVSQLRTTSVHGRCSPPITRRPRSPTPNQPTVDGFYWYHQYLLF
ncbi:hypothetical protein SprV_0301261900 [Sparganum proliferum]